MTTLKIDVVKNIGQSILYACVTAEKEKGCATGVNSCISDLIGDFMSGHVHVHTGLEPRHLYSILHHVLIDYPMFPGPLANHSTII
jgi:hypothetical protein